MRNLKDFKTFESDQMGTYLATSREDITNYYRCNKCNYLWNEFNEESYNCPYCNSTEIIPLSDFDYMAQIKLNKKPDEYDKEMNDKIKRSNQLIDLVDAGKYKQLKNYRKNFN